MQFLDNVNIGFDPYDPNVTADIFGYPTPGTSSDTNSGGFGDLLKFGGSMLFGNNSVFGRSPANNPIGTAQQAGNQLAYNLGQSASTAAMAAQGLGIKGQLLGVGASLLGEDAQLNRETNAILRGQQLNMTNLARENNAQKFKYNMAGRMSPMAIARASRMAYGA